MDNIKNVIEAQYKGNEAGLNWTKAYIEDKDLNESRIIRKECLQNQLMLTRVGFANDFNPAVAVYGESQVGKSYLVDNLLTTKRSPLNIYDGAGNKYGFIERINPIGGGKESTSLISRFTIKSYSDKTKPDFPICAVMLTPIDIVLILCDAYYNDVVKQKFPEKASIKEMITQLENRYKGKSEVQNIIKGVDIFEMKDYFENVQFTKGDVFIDDLITLGFFETLSECIGCIPDYEWKDVFGYLWNGNVHITEVFTKLVSTLKELGFKKRLYIKIDPLLREHGTILQVDRLYELFGLAEVTVDGKTKTVDEADIKDMEVWNGDNVITVQKSDFCALTAEVIFTIAEGQSIEEIKQSELVTEKPFLENMDVLDFPGARSRKQIDDENITKMETCLMLLRGKVAYLFNKYSKQYLISNLMFCHHDLKSEVSTLSNLLQGWIHSTVGCTPEERAEYIRASEISPLFIVGTKFNSDLVRTPIDSMGSDTEKEQAKKARWVKRFNSSLGDLIHESPKDPWFSRWTPGKPFQNMYLLRAFNYSCQSGVYVGYQTKNEKGDWVDNYREGILKEDDFSEEYKCFIADLKASFVKNDFVTTHFENPGESWDKAVEPNHDGSGWIIENLTKAAKTAFRSREMKFDRMLNDCFERLFIVLRKRYHDDKSDTGLKEALHDAGELDFLLDANFRKDEYLFSNLLELMLVKEEDFHDVIMNTINCIKVLDKTDISVLFAIRDRANVDSNASLEENRQRVKNAYHLSSDEELGNYLGSMNLTMDDIINPPQVMNIARIVVEEVQKCWFNNILNIDRFKEIVDRGIPANTLMSLHRRMKDLYLQKVMMTEKITEKIKPYISSPQQLDDMVDMLSDLCSEMINKFVNTMGTAYFGSGLWNRVNETVSFNNFDVNTEVAEKETITFDEENARKEADIVYDMYDKYEEILNEVPVDREKLKHFSNYNTYHVWTERMKVAYLVLCDIPQYDVDANKALKSIFQTRIIGVSELHPLIKSNMDISCFE